MSVVHIIENVNGKNFLPAKEFGDLRVVLTGKEPIDAAALKLHAAAAAFKEDDYLLLVGSPLHIAVAGYYYLRRFKSLKFLVWDRERYCYHSIQFDV